MAGLRLAQKEMQEEGVRVFDAVVFPCNARAPPPSVRRSVSFQQPAKV